MKSRLRTAALRSIFLLLLLSPLLHGAPATHAASPTHSQGHKPKVPKIRDLYDTVGGSVILTKFFALVQASNLGTFLSSRGPFTFFVPTNSAFSKLPPGMFEDMLLPENQTQLQRIILFHLVNGKILDAKDLFPLKSLISCEGNPLPLRTSRSRVQFVVKSKIIHADIKCANGIIHQIDTMLMPPKLVLVSKPAGGATGSDAATPGSSTNTPPVSDTNLAPTQTNAPAHMGGG